MFQSKSYKLIKSANQILQIRRGIVEICKGEVTEDGYDLVVTTTSDVWRGIMSQEKSALASNVLGGIKCNPSILSLKRFMGYFDTP